jgi:hypothetical protein
MVREQRCEFLPPVIEAGAVGRSVVRQREWAEGGRPGSRRPSGDRAERIRKCQRATDGMDGFEGRRPAARPGLVILVAPERHQDERSSSILTDTRTNSPEPGAIQLPATAHFFGSKGDRVTVICDTEAPTADQDAPTLKPD